MFDKKDNQLESFIDFNTSLNGNIHTKGTLRVDGNFEGNIVTDWLILGDKAMVKGEMTVKGITIGGAIEGNIHASEIVEIKPKGRVTGNIKTPKIIISEGGVFQGHSIMEKEPEKVLELEAKKADITPK